LLSSQRRSNLFSSLLVVLSAVSCLTSAATKSLRTLSARLSANTLSGELRRVQIRLRVILKISWDAVLLVLAGLLEGMRVQEGVANFRSLLLLLFPRATLQLIGCLSRGSNGHPFFVRMKFLNCLCCSEENFSLLISRIACFKGMKTLILPRRLFVLTMRSSL
jgi:hypothetical protein